MGGDVNVHVENGPAAPASPSGWGAGAAYLAQVKRIAPPELVGRETELRELAEFCLDPSPPSPYRWWQAGPWAGKSALMSTFVLHPPPQVRVVSFFITSRYAGQDTRDAFTTVLLNQLVDLAGQDLPGVLDESMREAHLLSLLELAAHLCQTAGGRLVLVVDGLDEDRGVTTGPDAHSIAALLPHTPPAGMRIIVAGRPDPPVPDDVEPWHPLRDRRNIRPLDASAFAQGLKERAERELKRLLKGTLTEQDLLGLLTAARGGLSGPDLTELTGAPLWEVEKVLHAVAGRTFTRRASNWAPDTGPEVYLLGHEELQTTAMRYLGDQRLTGYRDRLHAWADGYRAKGWPVGTPEYLLRGYWRLLQETGELFRMIACARDMARHDRMLDVTGGDTAALTETHIALDLLAAHPAPDPITALRLAYHRDQLIDRNSTIPASLPVVWARLGHHTRAQALAASITDPRDRAWALAAVAGALAQAGQDEQAVTIAAEAEQTARTIHPEGQAWVLAEVAGALAQAGQHEQAATIAATAARAITHDPVFRLSDLAAVAKALAQAGQHEQAEQTARMITHSETQARALAAVAKALAQAGQHERASAIAAEAEQTARTIHPDMRARALAAVAEALAQAGQHERAEQTARTITDPDPHWQARGLAAVAEALAQAGQHERAEQTARTITDPRWQAQALAEVAGALAQAGQHERASAIAAEAEQTAGTIIDWRDQVQALTAVAEAVAQAGQHERAEQTARTITHPRDRAWALTAVAGALAQTGHHQQAAAIAAQAEQTARTITDWRGRAQTLAAVAGALAQTGHHQQAAAMATQAEQAAMVAAQAKESANVIDLSDGQAWVLAAVAGALAQAAQYERAEQIALAIVSPFSQVQALATLATALAQAGQHQRAAAIAAQAEQTARTITDPYWQARGLALAEVAGALAQAGQHERAAAIAAQAEQTARTITDRHDRAGVLAAVAGALAQAGQRERAEQTARTITDPYWQARGLAAVAEALAQAGQHERAAAIAAQAEQTARTITDRHDRAGALITAVEALAQTGNSRLACHAAAEACAAGRWTSAVRPVLRLDPSAVSFLKDLLDDRV